MPLPRARWLLATCLALAFPLAVRGEPPPTDADGDPMPRGAIARVGSARFRQPSVWGVAFSPDGTVLVSGGYDNKVRLWDAATGRELRRLDGHREPIHCVAVSAEGKRIASGSYDRTVRVWDAATGKQLHLLGGHEASVDAVAFSPDGKWLASGGTDNSVRVWDLASGKEGWNWQGPQPGHHIDAVQFSPDGKLLASAGTEKGIDLWEAATGKRVRSIEGHGDRINALAWTPDGKGIVTGSFDRTVRLWDAGTGKELRRYGKEKALVRCLALSPDGKTVAAGDVPEAGDASTLTTWDVASGREVARWPAECDAPVSLAFSPGGKALAAAAGSKVRLFDPATGKRLNADDGAGSSVTGLAFSPDGRTLAVGREESPVTVWDVAARKERLGIDVPDGWWCSVAFSPDGKALAVASAGLRGGGFVRLWDVETGRSVRKFPDEALGAHSVTFSPTGDRLAAVVFRDVVVWDTARGAELCRIKQEQRSRPGLAFLPDGTALVAAAAGDSVRVWDADTGQLRRRLGAHEGAFGFATLAPDGRTVAAPGGARPGPVIAASEEDVDVVVWELATGRERLRLKGHERQVRAAAFSPDGRFVATAGDEDTLRIWDALDGEELRRLEGHRGAINALAWSPDGKTLASGGADTTALLWDVSDLKPPAAAAEKLTPERLDALWADLAEEDAARAGVAIRTLVAAPGQAVAFLRARLADSQALNPPRLAPLLADLDSDDFEVRERAHGQLARLGRLAEGELRQALKGDPTPEVRSRVGKLLNALERSPGGEPLRVLRTLEVLERVGTDDARRALAELAKRGEKEPFTPDAKAALDRLGRRSPP